ncbi:MAG: 8-amino-7-oxononanoate synthase [Candidatus Schekmanbacteria bacterium]|nr:8-amino-7-oxononanoate synthase [Candidatus Schekmanbacteria bacterium]
MDFIDEELKRLKDKNLYRVLRPVSTPQDHRIKIAGKSFILLSSNNYLGLANHKLIKKKSAEALIKYGTGAGASRLISGNIELYDELEKTISRFKRTESALVFSSGYAANVGTISALASEKDTIFSDELNHASIIDGCRLSGADIKVYPHSNADKLEWMVKKYRGRGKKFIITDSIFSMDGDIAPLGEIKNIASKHGCILFVDDAHATGVLGKTGRGSSELFRIDGRIDIYMGTLSKALGSAGGFICGKKELIDFLINKSRSFIYSTGLPPSALAAGTAAIELIEKDRSLRDKLLKNVEILKAGLDSLGYDTMKSETQIIPVLMKSEELAIRAFNFLYENGIFVPAIRPPTVPPNMSRLRITVMATHTMKEMEFVLDVFSKMRRAIRI